MTTLVNAKDIENIVGCMRDPHLHIGRFVTEEQCVYILHSRYCLDSGIDLRECTYSLALDNGFDIWTHDKPIRLTVDYGYLTEYWPWYWT